MYVCILHCIASWVCLPHQLGFRDPSVSSASKQPSPASIPRVREIVGMSRRLQCACHESERFLCGNDYRHLLTLTLMLLLVCDFVWAHACLQFWLLPVSSWIAQSTAIAKHISSLVVGREDPERPWCGEEEVETRCSWRSPALRRVAIFVFRSSARVATSELSWAQCLLMVLLRCNRCLNSTISWCLSAPCFVSLPSVSGISEAYEKSTHACFVWQWKESKSWTEHRATECQRKRSWQAYLWTFSTKKSFDPTLQVEQQILQDQSLNQVNGLRVHAILTSWRPPEVSAMLERRGSWRIASHRVYASTMRHSHHADWTFQQDFKKVNSQEESSLMPSASISTQHINISSMWMPDSTILLRWWSKIRSERAARIMHSTDPVADTLETIWLPEQIPHSDALQLVAKEKTFGLALKRGASGPRYGLRFNCTEEMNAYAVKYNMGDKHKWGRFRASNNTSSVGLRGLHDMLSPEGWTIEEIEFLGGTGVLFLASVRGEHDQMHFVDHNKRKIPIRSRRWTHVPERWLKTMPRPLRPRPKHFPSLLHLQTGMSELRFKKLYSPKDQILARLEGCHLRSMPNRGIMLSLSWNQPCC